MKAIAAVFLAAFLQAGAAFFAPPQVSYWSPLRRSDALTSLRQEWGWSSLPIFGALPKVPINFGAGAAEAERAKAKQALKLLVARTKQGKTPTALEREEIFRAMEAIEKLNPTSAPATSLLLAGKWSLLYTGASVEDAAQRRVKEGAIGSAVTELTGASEAPRGLGQVLGEDDEAALPLGRRLTTLAGRAVENKGNFQDIDLEKKLVENRAEFTLFDTPATVRIMGRCQTVPGSCARM